MFKKEREIAVPTRDEIAHGMQGHRSKIAIWGKVSCIFAGSFAIGAAALIGAYAVSDMLGTMTAFNVFSVAFWLFWGTTSLIFLTLFYKASDRWVDFAYWNCELDEIEDEALWDSPSEEID